MKYQTVEYNTDSLADIVVKLVTAAATGNMICTKYKDHILYSDKVSLDSAFLEIFGVSYAEALAASQTSDSPTAGDALDEASIMEAIVHRGHVILESQYFELWKHYVTKYISSPGFIEIFNCTLDILERVNRGNLKEAAAMYFSCPQAYQKNICLLVKRHSTYGENFANRVQSAERIYSDTNITGNTTFFS